jgi:dihydrofolate reductase
MRKFVVSMNLSLDGFMSGANAELDWHFDAWNEGMGEKLLELLEKADTILLGRHTYEVMAKYWPVKPLEQNFPRQDLAIADKMNRYTKIVFSKSDITLSWNNSKFACKDAETEIIRLKRQKGKDILLIGSGRLVTSVMESGLIDEYQLWIHPVILGKGNPLFKNCCRRINLELKDSVVFESGVIALNYKVIH